jgi:uncharacterized SAM-binding protein YcdF (DUF218 family)
MNPVVVTRPRTHWLAWVLSLAALALLAFLATTSFRIVREGSRSQLQSADAIVVFGAAEYDGRPSPVYRARLDHAFELYQHGLAPVVITTGGYGEDPKYSEGGVGRDYLAARGVPENNLIAETQGADSAQSAERVGVIMRTNHLRSCIAVSDIYHVFRVKKMLQRQGLEVYVAPRPESRPRTRSSRYWAVLREAVSYLVWKLHL